MRCDIQRMHDRFGHYDKIHRVILRLLKRAQMEVLQAKGQAHFPAKFRKYLQLVPRLGQISHTLKIMSALQKNWIRLKWYRDSQCNYGPLWWYRLVQNENLRRRPGDGLFRFQGYFTRTALQREMRLRGDSSNEEEPVADTSGPDWRSRRRDLMPAMDMDTESAVY
jgi:hypothetical protein